MILTFESKNAKLILKFQDWILNFENDSIKVTRISIYRRVFKGR